MTETRKPPCRRVVFSDGGAFYTTARQAPDFVFDRAFVHFLTISVFLFTSLMLVLDVPFVAQMIFFGAGLVSSFFWLTVTIYIYVHVLDKLRMTTIYTPVILLPTQLINTATIEYIVQHFDQSYLEGFNGTLEISVRTLIIILSLDIIHGRFVAPHHQSYVSPEDATKLLSGDIPNTPPAEQPVPIAPPSPAMPAQVSHQNTVQNTAGPVVLEETQQDDVTPVPPEAMTSPAPTRSASTSLTIASETFDLASVQFIKSEDHYLVVQEKTTSTMVRGKLRDVAARIDVALGVQINRSVWVAFSAIRALNETSNGRLEVHLNDGTVLRVAESRRVFFMHAYGKQVL